MKEYEIFSNLKVPCTFPTVVRLDGRNFSQLSRKLEFEKPYDLEFVRIISDATCMLFQEFSPKFAYVFSDEVNLLLGETPFAGRVEKIDSVMASFLCGAFTRKIMEHEDFKEKISETKPISFDSRVIPLSRDKVVKYFQWRQLESWRNCLNGYSYWKIREDHSQEEAMHILHKKKSNQLHDLLFEKGIKIAQMPTWQRRGIGIYKKGFEIEGLNPLTHEKVISQRKKIFVDWELPLFNEEFFKENSLLK
jgi:tRNA(His) guanylyltransferase